MSFLYRQYPLLILFSAYRTILYCTVLFTSVLHPTDKSSQPAPVLSY